mmetsp:Transcript_27448/g.59647  ORF Transcript_27448/g.59647 Transcript_27448/m.59647 type:complete len:234 (-) Transcript_27448:23-724(-)
MKKQSPQAQHTSVAPVCLEVSELLVATNRMTKVKQVPSHLFGHLGSWPGCQQGGSSHHSVVAKHMQDLEFRDCRQFCRLLPGCTSWLVWLCSHCRSNGCVVLVLAFLIACLLRLVLFHFHFCRCKLRCRLLAVLLLLLRGLSWSLLALGVLRARFASQLPQWFSAADASSEPTLSSLRVLFAQQIPGHKGHEGGAHCGALVPCCQGCKGRAATGENGDSGWGWLQRNNAVKCF